LRPTIDIIQSPVKADGTAGAASIFTTGINAPNGVAIDKHDNLWVCANQEDDVIVLDKTGKVIAKLGDFNGISFGGFRYRSTHLYEPHGRTANRCMS
jgi:hypothetical protein